MSYTTPRTWSVGETVTKAIMDQHVRDNLNEIWKYSALGDMMYGVSSTASARLAIGTAGQTLTVSSGSPAWSGGVSAVYTTSDGSPQALTSGGTASIVNFSVVDFDSGSYVTTGASWKFTAPYTGYYHVSAMLQFEGFSGWSANELAYMAVYKNGSIFHYLDRKEAQNTFDLTMALTGSIDVQLNAGQYIDLRAFQSSGSTLDIYPHDGCYIAVHLIR